MALFKSSSQVFSENMETLEGIETQAMKWIMSDNWLLRFIGGHAADFAHEQKQVAVNRTFENAGKRR